LIIEPSFTIEKTADRDADVELGMTMVMSALERAISNAPDQWVMFQQVWPDDETATTA
jgi:lauroyl/myristoyl acyltransferase